MAGLPPPFHAEGVRIARGARSWLLDAPSPDGAWEAARAFAGIDPWRAYGRTGDQMAQMFAPPERPDGTFRIVARTGPDAPPAALALVQSPWLAGPYVRFLGVLPEHQGDGLGTALLGWIEAEARRARARNLWICVSAFNEGAFALYRRVGFEPVAEIPDLAADGIAERLLRKRLGS